MRHETLKSYMIPHEPHNFCFVLFCFVFLFFFFLGGGGGGGGGVWGKKIKKIF